MALALCILFLCIGLPCILGYRKGGLAGVLIVPLVFAFFGIPAILMNNVSYILGAVVLILEFVAVIVWANWDKIKK